MARTCVISRHPIDLISHTPSGPWQVSCPASRWHSSLFNDLDEAIKYRATIDIPAAVAAARREERDGMARLVGDRFMTQFMTSSELDRLVAEVGALPPKASRRRSSSSNA